VAKPRVRVCFDAAAAFGVNRSSPTTYFPLDGNVNPGGENVSFIVAHRWVGDRPFGSKSRELAANLWDS